MPLSIQESLTRDHGRLDALLERSVADPTRFDHQAFAAFRAGLLRHIAMEEKVLLRDARCRLHGAPLPMARQLRVEHGALTSLLVPTPDAALVVEIRSLLLRHNALEEGPEGVYARCAELAGDDEAELVTRMEAVPAVPLMPYQDGPRVKRTAEAALAAAERIRMGAP